MPETPLVQPYDVHNQFLVSNAHPPDWANPEPAVTGDILYVEGGAHFGRWQ
jgi:hypothetical protein